MRAKAKRAIAVAALLLGAAWPAATAYAQTEDELQQARALFEEAYKDEQASRFQDALEKFRRVQHVKDSPSVRYRIASVLEGLGQLRDARDAFRGIAASKATLPQKDQAVADGAADRASALDKRIPHLTLTLEGNAPPDVSVTIDGRAVPATSAPNELDPGEHVVQASGTGIRPYASKVKLESGDVSLTVALQPLEATPPPPPPPAPNHTLAYVALGAGGALLVTGVVLLVVRAGDIGAINDACNDGVCPSSERDALTSDHDQAKLFGPLGVGFAAVGVVAAGFGAYLLLKPPARAAAAAGSELRFGAQPLAAGGAMTFGGTY